MWPNGKTAVILTVLQRYYLHMGLTNTAVYGAEQIFGRTPKYGPDDRSAKHSFSENYSRVLRTNLVQLVLGSLPTD